MIQEDKEILLNRLNPAHGKKVIVWSANIGKEEETNFTLTGILSVNKANEDCIVQGAEDSIVKFQFEDVQSVVPILSIRGIPQSIQNRITNVVNGARLVIRIDLTKPYKEKN